MRRNGVGRSLACACGVVFTSASPRSLYCGPECRRLARNGNLRRRRNREADDVRRMLADHRRRIARGEA